MLRKMTQRWYKDLRDIIAKRLLLGEQRRCFIQGLIVLATDLEVLHFLFLFCRELQCSSTTLNRQCQVTGHRLEARVRGSRTYSPGSAGEPLEPVW